jgi:hypothetical protein
MTVADDRGRGVTTLDDHVLFDPPTPSPIGSSRRAKAAPDPERQRQNKRNKANGRGTSRDLADYLGGRDVELLGLPWDVEARGCRVQSKRDKAACGPVRALGLLRHVGEHSDDLAAVFHVLPRQRLVNGTAWALLEAWVGWHGWALPAGASLHLAGGVPLISMPLPAFGDHHIGKGEHE